MKILASKQRTTATLTFRLARGDKKKIDILKAHYRQVSAGAVIKILISDAVERINKSRDTVKILKDTMETYGTYMTEINQPKGSVDKYQSFLGGIEVENLNEPNKSKNS